MKIKNIFWIAIVMFIYLVSLTDNVNASDKKSTKAKSKAVINKVNSKSLAPFDTNTEKLPVNFTGHDIKRIYDALTKANKSMVKDEFESTEQYNDRISALSNSILVDKFKYNDTYAYVHNKLEFEYNADNELLTVKIEDHPFFYKPAIDALKISEKTSKYKAGNSFGAKVTVMKAEIVNIMFYITNWETFQKAPEFSDGYQMELKLNISPEKAKSLNKKGAYLFVYKLKPPYLKESRGGLAPNMNSPFDVTTFEKNIQAEVLEMWLFNSTTGEIIKKIKI